MKWKLIAVIATTSAEMTRNATWGRESSANVSSAVGTNNCMSTPRHLNVWKIK